VTVRRYVEPERVPPALMVISRICVAAESVTVCPDVMITVSVVEGVTPPTQVDPVLHIPLCCEVRTAAELPARRKIRREKTIKGLYIMPECAGNLRGGNAEKRQMNAEKSYTAVC